MDGVGFVVKGWLGSGVVTNEGGRCVGGRWC